MSSMRDLINQLDTLNNTLSNVSVVRDEPDDAAAAPTTNVLSTPHIALIKQLANRHGWTTDGNEIEWRWSDQDGNIKPTNKFTVNIWTRGDGLATVLNARTEHAESIFGDPESWHDVYDCRKELSGKDL